MTSNELVKIQFYAVDLAYALDLPEICDMYVATLDGGGQVLRITHLPQKEDEYQTVKTRPKATKSQPKPRKHRGISGPGPVQSDPLLNTNEATGIGSTILNMGKKFMANKEKPNFMRDAGF